MILVLKLLIKLLALIITLNLKILVNQIKNLKIFTSKFLFIILQLYKIFIKVLYTKKLFNLYIKFQFHI